MDQLKISRELSFLDPEIGADCKFLVGADFADMEQEISGHRAIFANASPVFNRMFYGSVPETGDLIKVPEIQPETFHTMVNFFYTGEITIVSVEKAIDLWYVADKYNIAEFIKYIPDYLIKNMTPQNVLYIWKSSILFRNKFVMEECQKVISGETSGVLMDASFLEADISTVSLILDQKTMNVSEVDLFRALVRYDKAVKRNNDDARSEQPPSTFSAKTVSGDLEVKEQSASDGNCINSCGEGSSMQEGTATQVGIIGTADNPLNDLVKKIRFLAMTPKEFCECLEMSSLISHPEAHNILVNVCNPAGRTHPMPEGYCMIKEKRELKTDSPNVKKYYCYHSTEEMLSSVYIHPTKPETREFSLIFKCSSKIKMTGVKLNMSGECKLTIEILNNYNHEVLHQSQNVTYIRSVVQEIPFDHALHIEPNSYFTIKVKLHTESQNMTYFTCKCLTTYYCTVNDVTFTFCPFRPDICLRNCNGFFNSIIFTT